MRATKTRPEGKIELEIIDDRPVQVQMEEEEMRHPLWVGVLVRGIQKSIIAREGVKENDEVTHLRLVEVMVKLETGVPQIARKRAVAKGQNVAAGRIIVEDRQSSKTQVKQSGPFRFQRFHMMKN